MAKKKQKKDAAAKAETEKKTRKRDPDAELIKQLDAKKPKTKEGYKRGKGGKKIKDIVIREFKKNVDIGTAKLITIVRKECPGTKFDSKHVSYYRHHHNTGALYLVAKKKEPKEKEKATRGQNDKKSSAKKSRNKSA